MLGQPGTETNGRPAAAVKDADVAAEETAVQTWCQAWLQQLPGAKLQRSASGHNSTGNASPGASAAHDFAVLADSSCITDGVLFLGLSKVFRRWARMPEASGGSWWHRWWMRARQCVVRQNHAAVRPMWLRLQPGSCFCMLGPNGAGKTTTINCLQGVSCGVSRLMWCNTAGRSFCSTPTRSYFAHADACAFWWGHAGMGPQRALAQRSESCAGNHRSVPPI
jgi:hypothetical protein